MANSEKKPRFTSIKTQALDETSFPYHNFVKSDPVLKSIFSRIRTGQHHRFSEFAHFIDPLVQDFEAAGKTRLATSCQFGLPVVCSAHQQCQRLQQGLPVLLCAREQAQLEMSEDHGKSEQTDSRYPAEQVSPEGAQLSALFESAA